MSDSMVEGRGFIQILDSCIIILKSVEFSDKSKRVVKFIALRTAHLKSRQ